MTEFWESHLFRLGEAVPKRMPSVTAVNLGNPPLIQVALHGLDDDDDDDGDDDDDEALTMIIMDDLVNPTLIQVNLQNGLSCSCWTINMMMMSLQAIPMAVSGLRPGFFPSLDLEEGTKPKAMQTCNSKSN